MQYGSFEKNKLRNYCNIKGELSMFYSVIKKFILVSSAVVLIILGGCATTKNNVYLEPGEQITKAEVDLETGAVSQDQDSVLVSVQAAMLPGPYEGDNLYPSFWVTIQNNRKTQISLKPGAARLIDSFGNQLNPEPMSVETRDREVVDRYVIVDPEIHLYFGLHYGWRFYPMYPYPRWRRHGHFFRRGFGWYDPFWDFGPRVVWVRRIVSEKSVGNQPEKLETIYNDAKITYLVVFPELSETVKDMRLIIPGITIQENQTTKSLDFELVFNQIIEVPEKK
jgi:hypothetical protein